MPETVGVDIVENNDICEHDECLQIQEDEQNQQKIDSETKSYDCITQCFSNMILRMVVRSYVRKLYVIVVKQPVSHIKAQLVVRMRLSTYLRTFSHDLHSVTLVVSQGVHS
uniref:Uncharacterized protein n=1 Tax=Timema poppense TaxID=170557 RepID=A0A7R9CI36_TIMPO|nr:unnamed protein product [Timema poppensis]